MRDRRYVSYILNPMEEKEEVGFKEVIIMMEVRAQCVRVCVRVRVRVCVCVCM